MRKVLVESEAIAGLASHSARLNQADRTNRAGQAGGLAMLPQGVAAEVDSPQPVVAVGKAEMVGKAEAVE